MDDRFVAIDFEIAKADARLLGDESCDDAGVIEQVVVSIR